MKQIAALVCSIVILFFAGCESATVTDGAAIGENLFANHYKPIRHFDTGYVEAVVSGPALWADNDSIQILLRTHKAGEMGESSFQANLYGCFLRDLNKIPTKVGSADLAAFGGYYSNGIFALYVGSNLLDGGLGADITDGSSSQELRIGCSLTRDDNGVETITAYLNRTPISQYVIKSSSNKINITSGDPNLAPDDPGLDDNGLVGFAIQSENEGQVRLKSFIVYDKFPE